MTTIEPVPGDASTEPVATGTQSHVSGRVGPPSIAQDATTDAQSNGVDQIEPGEVKPAETPIVGQIVEHDEDAEDESQSDGPVTTKRDPAALKPKGK